jgi:uncharacterized protein
MLKFARRKKIIIGGIILLIIISIFSFNYLINNILPYSIIKPIRTQAKISADETLNKNQIKYDILTSLTYDSLKLDLRYIYSEDTNSHKVVILLHGISANKEECVEKGIILSHLGYNSIIFDLRSHGNSEGAFNTYGFKEKYDIKSIIDLVLIRYGKDYKFAVWGASLGGAIALQSLELDNRICCGIIESTFATLNEVVRDYAKNMFYIPCDDIIEKTLQKAEIIAGFSADSVKPEKSAKNIFMPVLIIHGTKDEKISINYGYRIFNNLSSKFKEFYPIENAGHLNVMKIGGKAYLDKIENFLKSSF